MHAIYRLCLCVLFVIRCFSAVGVKRSRARRELNTISSFNRTRRKLGPSAERKLLSN